MGHIGTNRYTYPYWVTTELTTPCKICGVAASSNQRMLKRSPNLMDCICPGCAQGPTLYPQFASLAIVDQFTADMERLSRLITRMAAINEEIATDLILARRAVDGFAGEGLA